MKTKLLMIIGIGILGFTTNVFALESDNPTPLELWESNELVIDGTVIEVDTERTFSEELIRSYQIKVHEYFKGSHKFDLVYAQEPFSNKYFKTGERVLFYLYKDNSNSYQVHSSSLKTLENCNARDLIEISPVLPNEKPPISTPILDENFIDSCIPDYYDVDPDFGGITIYSAPLKQVNIGIEPQNVQCQDPNKTLVLKIDGSPACVTLETREKLIERGWTAKDESILKTSTNCMTLEQNKETAPFFKTPTYLPEGYFHVCSQSGTPSESYIVYHHQEILSWNIHELVSDGAIFIYQIDEMNIVRAEKFETLGTAEQRIQETYDSVMKGNPSLLPQLIRINEVLAYAVDSCSNCSMQTANFTNGTFIQKLTSTETKIKFIDENGVNYMLKTILPLDELILVAESLQ